MSIESFDYLGEVAGITPEQLRSAGVTLADQSLIAAGLDGEAAAEPLRTALQAIGAYPYESGTVRKARFGEARAS